MVFREGRTKAVGNVTLVIPHNPIGQKDKEKAGTSSQSSGLGGDKTVAKAARNEQRHRTKDKEIPAAPSTAKT